MVSNVTVTESATFLFFLSFFFYWTSCRFLNKYAISWPCASVFVLYHVLCWEFLPPKTFPSESYSCKNLTCLFNYFPNFLCFFVIVCELDISLFLVLSNATETLHKSHILYLQFSSVQSLSRVRLFVTPWIAAHQASRSITNSRSSLRQTHVHQVGDAIQPSHPLSSPSPSAPNPCQHQSLFQWVSSSQQMAKTLELQQQPFQWMFRVDFL